MHKRLKNPRVKGKKDRYRVPDNNWDLFQNLTSQSTTREPSCTFGTEEESDESDESFSID